MNQHLVSIFSIVKNEKVFQFMSGAATFDEVMEVLEQFKVDFQDMKKQQEEKLAQENAAKESASSDVPVVDAEVVS